MLGSSEMRRQLLRSSALFSHLGDKEADAILAEARVVNYAEGDHIFAKGDPGNSMMAVLKGRVVISNPSLDGRQLVVTIFRESDVFGEIALLDGKERSADASAATDCELLVVPRRSLLRLLGQQPELCIELLVVLCERLRRTNEQVEDFAFLDLEARIAKTLLRLTRDEKGASSTSRLGLKISQRALARRAGAVGPGARFPHRPAPDEHRAAARHQRRLEAAAHRCRRRAGAVDADGMEAPGAAGLGAGAARLASAAVQAPLR